MATDAGQPSTRDRTQGSVSLELPPEPKSASIARDAVRELLTSCHRDEWVDAAELAVSELVTNAVLHAHTVIRLRLHCSVVLRVEVEDGSPVLPSLRTYGTSASTGRGMAMVAAVTASHGVTPLAQGGKVVWFTVSDTVQEEQDLDDLLAAWDDDLLLSVPLQAQATVVLVGLPPTLWLAAAQQHDALLRELAMLPAGTGQTGEELIAVDRARFAIRAALDRAIALAHQQGLARNPLPPGHPSRFDEVPPSVDLVVPVAPDAATDFAMLQDVLDEGERLARSGQLLARPGLPEVTAVRDWAAEQVVAQLAGQAPMPWPGTHDDRFAHVLDGAVAEFDWDSSFVRDSDRGAVAADDQNRILAISRPLADVLGWAADDLVGRRVVAIVPPQFREAHVAGMTRHLTTGEAHALNIDLQLPVLCADGTQVDCNFFIEAHRSRSGRAAYVAWVTPLDG